MEDSDGLLEMTPMSAAVSRADWFALPPAGEETPSIDFLFGKLVLKRDYAQRDNPDSLGSFYLPHAPQSEALFFYRLLIP